MKIGLFDPYLDTMSGGEKYILTIARCLAKEHTVSIFWDKQQEVSMRKKASFQFGYDLDNIAFEENIFDKRVSLIKRLRESMKYDRIIYLSDGSIPTVLTTLLLHFQTPVEWVRPTVKTYLKTRFVRAFFCNSEFTKSYIDRKFHVKSRVIYPPVTLGEETGSSKKEKYILNVGRYGINHQGSSFKKQDVLRDEFKHMVKNGLKDYTLVFIMNVKDEEREKVRSFEKSCKNFPIKVIINPPNQTLWSYYHKAKIYWHAAGFGEDITLNPDRAEHFGMTTVEAMSTGCVPIVYNGGGQREIVKENENGFVWDDPKDLREKTDILIKNTQIWKRLSQNALLRSKNFDGSQFCQNMYSLVS